MARDLLTPLISNVASKVAFSADNQQLDEMRSSLSPEILDWQDWDDTKHRVRGLYSRIF